MIEISFGYVLHKICTLFITVFEYVQYELFTNRMNSNHFVYWKYPVLKRNRFVLFDDLRDDGLCQNDLSRNNNRHHKKYWIKF